MKRFFSILLKILGGVLVFVILILVIAFYSTSGIVTVADEFFQAVKEKNIAKAHSYLAEDFKASTDEAALSDFLSKGAILNYKDSSWSERSVENGQGKLSGSVTTESGGTVPIEMTFTKENDAWKIYSIQKQAAGLQSASNAGEETTGTAAAPPTAAASSIPSKAEQIALVSQSMHDFAISINAKSMDHFRKGIAKIWQDQATTKDLNETYGSYIKAEADLSILDNLEPNIEDGVKADENGMITLKGYYPTKPKRVNFEQGYIYEGGAWKLVMFNALIK
jgi:hypothetical protein